MRRVCSLALAAAVLTAGAAAAGAAEAPVSVHIVPGNDPVLATIFLAAKSRREPVLLFDSEDQNSIRETAALWSMPRLCFFRASTPHGAVELMESIAGQPCSEVADLAALVYSLWPDPQRVVLFPESDYPAMLRAAALASVIDAALFPVAEPGGFRREALGSWKPTRLLAFGQGWDESVVGDEARLDLPGAAIQELIQAGGDSPPRTVVVANPGDRQGIFSPSSLSLVAPLVSAMHGAPLVLVEDADPKTIEAAVTAFIDENRLPTSHIILVGDELALRSHRIPDPVLEAGGPLARGGGKIVRVEIFSEIHEQKPQDFAVGRILADNAEIASLNLARRLHGPPPRKGRPVVFLANADQVFALGETISRTTVQDMQNVGVPVRAFYRDEVTMEVSQQSLAQTDVLVWEGHPRDLTLEERGGIAVDTAPQVVFLQGCYTLDRSDPFILIEKGTQAIIATSAAIYSASGSALARAFFDSAVHGSADLGTALRDARNFLLAVAKLKQQRGHGDWRKTWRAAMAFALWGDPTMMLPIKPGRPTQTLARWQAGEDGLKLTVPRGRLRQVSSGEYRASPAPRAMLSGLLWRDPKDERRSVRELYFTAVEAPEGKTAACAPEGIWDVTSLYAPRSRTLFVLALPEWQEEGKKPGRAEVTFPLRAEPEACAPEAKPSE